MVEAEKVSRPQKIEEEAARAAGIHQPHDLDLAVVDRRRTQLWSTSLFVVAAFVVVLALMAIGPDFLPEALRLEELSSWVTLTLVGGLMLAFLIYIVEKEASLRRLSKLLVEEREKNARLQEMDELKTPLTAIIGAAQTLGRRGAHMSEEQHETFIDMIERQGTKLLRLVEDVLDTTRLESGDTGLRREEVDLRNLAERVIGDLSQTEVGMRREVLLLAEPDRPRAWGDPTALQQVLGNLVENALKYSPEETKVVVTVRESEKESLFEVFDLGQGISPEQISTIFDRFRQADSTASRGSSGFGLGLYIVKNLVAAHHGDVEVASEVGVGSTFRVRLPKRAGELS